MKTHIVCWLFACLSSATIAQTIGKDFIFSWEKIHLTGDWKDGDLGDETGSRSIPYIPISATLGESVIAITFDEPVGSVEVIIRQGKKAVHVESLVVDSSMKILIDIDSYSSGIYSIEVLNLDGGCVTGWFDLKSQISGNKYLY